MRNLRHWFVRFHEEGPNTMVVPPPKYSWVHMSARDADQPTRLIVVSMELEK